MVLSAHNKFGNFKSQFLHDARKAGLVKLRYFAGLSFEEAADVLGVSVITAKRDWAYARAWLHHAIDRK